MRVRIFTPVVLASFLLIFACVRNESPDRMPLSTDSELAIQLYEVGLIAYDQLKWELAWSSFQASVEEDPKFFMPYFFMYFISPKNSKLIAEKAFQAPAERLNQGEKLVRTAFKYLLDGEDGKVVENLKKAVDLYPADPHVHKMLYIIQLQILKDLDGAIASMKHTIDLLPDYPAVYNHMGYAYMNKKEYDKAEEAFDNYIRLDPLEANPYDSKGDFYMEIKEYERAYESYLKAYEINSRFEVSRKKAEKAKQLMERVSI